MEHANLPNPPRRHHRPIGRDEDESRFMLRRHCSPLRVGCRGRMRSVPDAWCSTTFPIRAAPAVIGSPVMTRRFVIAFGALISIAGCNCSEEATCLPAPLSATETIEPGPMCPAGGTLVRVGGDFDCSGTFEEPETTSTVVVCTPPS